MGKFGKSLVRSWLETNGESLLPHEVHVTAASLGLSRFPSGRLARRFDIVNLKVDTAYEVKTMRSLFMWEQDRRQFLDYLAWRDAIPERKFVLAVVNFFRGRVIIPDNLLEFAREETMLPVLRFSIEWT